ncbi:hypothetical protein Save01_01012 [Streptomyces avermitilis]
MTTPHFLPTISLPAISSPAPTPWLAAAHCFPLTQFRITTFSSLP